MKSRAWKGKDGAALLIAMIIMMVLTVLGLSLATVSAQLFRTVGSRGNIEQCRELAQGFCRVLDREIAGPHFEDVQEREAARADGQYALWFYLQENIRQGVWPSHNEDERGHRLSDDGVCREFALNIDEDTGARITVEFYWERAGQSEDTGTGSITLSARVTCAMGREKSVITGTYGLQSDAGQELWQWKLLGRE